MYTYIQDNDFHACLNYFFFKKLYFLCYTEIAEINTCL